MNRSLVLFGAFPCFLFAQFAELATTGDGKQLYFTSTLKWKGQAPDRAEYRIYRAIETGDIQLFAERGDLAFKFGGGSSDGARSPQVSADGETVALTLQGICESTSGCTSNSRWRAEIRGRYASVLGDGAVYLSGNARWALFVPHGIPGMNTAPGASPLLINLETGDRGSVPPLSPFLSRPLASDGSVIVQETSVPPGTPASAKIALWSAGNVTPINLPDASSIWGRSDDGALLVYTEFTSAISRLHLMARFLATGKDVELASANTPAIPLFMGVSSDGRRVLYRIAGSSAAGPAFIVDTSTGSASPIPLPSGEFASDGALSGLGNVAYLVTTTGRIVRYDLTTGALIEAVPPTPYIRNSYQFSPGSLLRLDGTLPHSQPSLDGAILLNNLPVPILWVNDREIAVQTPWELANTFEGPLRLDITTDSPLQQNELVHLPGMAPRFEGTAPAGVALPGVAIAADWSSIFTADPQPGQIFHMYLTGLGAVEGMVPTGAQLRSVLFFPYAVTSRAASALTRKMPQRCSPALHQDSRASIRSRSRCPQCPIPESSTAVGAHLTRKTAAEAYFGVHQWVARTRSQR
jgi:hypothetical protein